MNGQVANIDAACPGNRPKTKWRWPTVVFAAVPATLLAFPAALAILLGGVFSLSFKPTALALFFCGVLGWAGMISLWLAARSPGVVTKRTAWGLVGGIVSVLIYYGFEIFTDEQDNRLWASTPLVTIGPLLFAIAYLKGYRRQACQIEAKKGGGNSERVRMSHGDVPPPITPVAQPVGAALARPFNEVRMRRILELMLIIPAIIELIFVPRQLMDRPGLGTVAVIVGVFPFYLAIAVTAVWCFWRSRSLRWLAGAALVTPIVLPFVLHGAVHALGQEATEKVAIHTAIAIPILMLLLKPKRIASYLPSFVVEGRGWNMAWTAMLAVMLIGWAFLAILFFALGESALKSSFAFVMWYTGASIIVASGTLIAVYVGLRAQRRRQTRLRIAQLVLSLLLLLIAAPAAIAIWLMFSLAGLG